jgi:hypothetical protein
MIVTNSRISEGESIWIEVIAHDTNGALVIPTQMNWWWTDLDGSVVNSRNNISVDSGDLGTTTTIELTPDDTTLPANTRYDQIRIFTVRYVYNSIHGNDKVKTASCKILITSLFPVE